MEIKVSGLSRARELLKAALTVDVGLSKVVTALAADRLREETYRRTPVKTGRLRASGHVSTVGENILYRNPRHYAPYVEYGTGRRGQESWKDFFGFKRLEDYLPELPEPTFARRWPGMSAQPFIRPAVVITMDELMEYVRRTVEEKLR